VVLLICLLPVCSLKTEVLSLERVYAFFRLVYSLKKIKMRFSMGRNERIRAYCYGIIRSGYQKNTTNEQQKAASVFSIVHTIFCNGQGVEIEYGGIEYQISGGLDG